MTIDEVWEQIGQNQGKIFHTVKGLDFTYSIKGGCIFISRKDKEITKATVLIAYKEAVELDGIVKGPKKLKCFGASYLYPIFIEIGFIRKS